MGREGCRDTKWPTYLNRCGGKVSSYHSQIFIHLQQGDETIPNATTALQERERIGLVAQLREGRVEVMTILEKPVSITLVKIVPVVASLRLKVGAGCVSITVCCKRVE